MADLEIRGHTWELDHWEVELVLARTPTFLPAAGDSAYKIMQVIQVLYHRAALLIYFLLIFYFETSSC